MGTWKKNSVGDNSLSLMEIKPLILQLVTQKWDPWGRAVGRVRHPLWKDLLYFVTFWGKKSSENTEDMGQQWW